MKRWFLFNYQAILFFVLLNIPLVSMADENFTGKIDRVTGTVTLEREDGSRATIRKGSLLFPGDRIITGKKGTVWITLRQGQQLKLGWDARLEIDELSGPEMEDGRNTVRLVLGYLWSKIQKISGTQDNLEIHTPTTVIGVRGTEFDAVVSLDATTLIAVDEGRVEVDDQEERVLLDTGEMTRVELGAKPIRTEKAAPKAERDWQAWRKKRARQLFYRLPKVIPRLRKRFEKAVEKSSGFHLRVKTASDRLHRLMERARKAEREGDKEALVQSVRQLKARLDRYNRAVAVFRRGLNRVRAMGGISVRMGEFISRNRGRFDRKDLTGMEADLAVISRKRMELKEIYRRTILDIRRTYRESRELRRELRKEWR